MLFSSIPFLYCFLPCVLLLYFLAPGKLKNAVLLMASVVFYAWGEPLYVFLMLGTIVLNYVFGLLIEGLRGKKAAKVFLALAVGADAALLGLFKYADFIVENVNAVAGLSLPLPGIALPIGISFYTFQLISYVVDVYRGGAPAQKNPVDLAAYIAMFAQLIAGPIVRYSDISAQLRERKHTADMTAYGICRFISGLAKKIIIANSLGELCDIFRASDEKSVLFYWMYAVGFSLHIYFDFSGYSDMAIGLGKIFGFDFPENFDHPFVSRSVTEFWRRWHISLGSWFRDYVYIPMGGNRVSKPRWVFNILVVWALTGLWHGAAWNFAVWGLFFALLLILEKPLIKRLERLRVLGRAYVLFAVMISFVIFNAGTLTQAAQDIGGLFGAGGIPLASAQSVYYLRSYAALFALAIIGSTTLVKKLFARAAAAKHGKAALSVAQPLALAALLLIMTGYLVDGSFNPFLYFRF